MTRGIGSCIDPTQRTTMSAPVTPTITTELHVTGMSCQHCVKAVTQAVQALDAQAQVTIDLAKGHVQVLSTLSAQAVADAITEEGYGVSA